MLLRHLFVTVNLMGLLAWAILASAYQSAHGAPVLKERPTSLPDNVVKAWEDAGAVAGWMGQCWDGSLD